MDQLGNKISLVLSKNVLSVHKDICRINGSNKFYDYFTDDFVIEQSNEGESSEPIFTQTSTIIVRMSEAERLLFHNQNTIVKLYTLRDKNIIWGTKEYPVNIVALPHLDKVSLMLTCKTSIPLKY